MYTCTHILDHVCSVKRNQYNDKAISTSVMCYNENCFALNVTFSPCSLDGVPRNRSSLFQGISLASSVIVAFCSPVALVGNALVLVAIWRNPSHRTPFYVLLAGLAFTDLFTGLFTQPMHVAFEVACLQNAKEIYESIPLILVGSFLGSYFIGLTLIFITLMSIERWLHMTRRSLLTVRRICFIVAVISAFLMITSVMLVVRVLQILSAMSFLFFFFCVIITSVSYFKVYRIIRRQQQQVQANEAASQNFGRQAIDLAKYKKSVFSILYILGVFYISYIPILVIGGLFMFFMSDELEMGRNVCTLFLLMSSSVNPLIYIWRMNEIRNGVKCFLMKMLCME